MNLKFNAAHQYVLELLRQHGIRCLVDDQYDELNEHYLQLWLAEPLTEIEVKQLNKFQKQHFSLWKDSAQPWEDVKMQVKLDFSDSCYNELKATLVKMTLVDRMTFERAWQERLGVVCNNVDLDVIAHRCTQVADIDPLTKAIADSFSDEWLKLCASMELFQVRYLVFNRAVRKDKSARNSEMIHLWTDTEGENPKQARKAVGRVTGNPGGIVNYQKGARVIRQGNCVRKTKLYNHEFEDAYQRRVRVNIKGVMVPMMNHADLLQLSSYD